MKEKLAWHEECLQNTKSTYDRDLREFLSLVKIKRQALKKMKKEVLLYQEQVDTAKKQKKDGFDRDRFLVSKKEVV